MLAKPGDTRKARICFLAVLRWHQKQDWRADWRCTVILRAFSEFGKGVAAIGRNIHAFIV